MDTSFKLKLLLIFSLLQCPKKEVGATKRFTPLKTKVAVAVIAVSWFLLKGSQGNINA
jgi:hypothetical protein